MSGLKRGALAVLAAALLSGGCATGYESNQTYAGEPTTVAVANYNWSDMNIYMVVNGTRHRLGTVTSMGRQVFSLPSYALASAGQVYLLADPIGSAQTHLSPPLLMRSGQRAEWRLENAIQLSSLWVR